MNYLIKTTEVYRCDTEKEANELIYAINGNENSEIIRESGTKS